MIYFKIDIYFDGIILLVSFEIKLPIVRGVHRFKTESEDWNIFFLDRTRIFPVRSGPILNRLDWNLYIFLFHLNIYIDKLNTIKINNFNSNNTKVIYSRFLTFSRFKHFLTYNFF